jgi:hypothetical protein
LEELLASKENLLELSPIISRNWSIAAEEDNNYIRIYPDANVICCCFQGFSFRIVCYDPRVGLNILLLDEASDIDMQPLMPTYAINQDSTVAAGTEHVMQGCGSHNHINRGE